MEKTNVIPVLLICQHLTGIYGDLLFPPRYDRLPLEPAFQQLTQSLHELEQLLREPFTSSQQPNLPQQPPYLPFQQQLQPQQQPYLPLQQLSQPQQPPYLPFQQQPYLPIQQQLQPQQQPYLPLQQLSQPQQPPYRLFQPPDLPLQQPPQYFNQQPPPQTSICPLPAPICTDGRPAICTRNAATGFPVYNCLNPTVHNGFPWSASPPSSLANPTFSRSNFFNSTGSGITGARSLLEWLWGSKPDAASESSVGVDASSPEGLSPSNGFDVREQSTNPSIEYTNGPYPLSNQSCSFKNTLASCLSCCFQQPFLLGTFAPLLPCNPCSSSLPLPLGIPPPPSNQLGHMQPVTSVFESQAGQSLTAATHPGYPNPHPYYSSSQFFPQVPQFLKYTSSGMSGRNDVTVNLYDNVKSFTYGNPHVRNEFPPVDVRPAVRPSGFQVSDHSGPGANALPIRVEQQWKPYHPQISEQYPIRQQVLPSYVVGNEPKLQDTVNSVLPNSMNYISPGSSHTSRKQGIIQLSNSYNPTNERIHTEFQSHQNQQPQPLQQPTPYQRYSYFQDLLTPQSYPFEKNSRRKGSQFQANSLQNPQKLPPYLYSGLSLLPILDEETPRGDKSINSVAKPPLVTKSAKKTSNPTRKPSKSTTKQV